MPLNLDEINAFLKEVQEGATDDPSSFASTAIQHFKKLLDVALQLSAAVEYQTVAIQKLLDMDLATITHSTVSMQPVPSAAAQPQTIIYQQPPVQYMPPPMQYQQPQYQQPQYASPPVQYQQPPAQQAPWALTPEQIAQRQQQVQVEPAEQPFFDSPAPQQQWPTRNGAVIQPQHPGLASAMAAANPPALPNTFGTRNDGNRYVRRDRV